MTCMLGLLLQADWAKFAPVVSCPEDRPLTTYGQGDGSKLLCDIGGLGRQGGSPCIIYSLGSNGKPYLRQELKPRRIDIRLWCSTVC